MCVEKEINSDFEGVLVLDFDESLLNIFLSKLLLPIEKEEEDFLEEYKKA